MLYLWLLDQQPAQHASGSWMPYLGIRLVQMLLGVLLAPEAAVNSTAVCSRQQLCAGAAEAGHRE